MSFGFEWNHRKARTDLQKHGIEFVEAATVFSKATSSDFADEGSTDEPREIIIGQSSRGSPRGGKDAIMRIVSPAKTKRKQQSNGLANEYRFDPGKANPNRFAKRAGPGSIAVLLDLDVAQVFETGEAVNAVLR